MKASTKPGAVQGSLRAMRASCRRFLDDVARVADGSYGWEPDVYRPDHSAQWDFGQRPIEWV